MLAVYLLCGGRLELDHSLFFPDRIPGTRYTVPIPCVLVVHPRGGLLFDTGIHRDTITDPVGRLGEARARRFGVRSGPDEEVVGQLAQLGLTPDDVAYVANSHFHFDHAGGTSSSPARPSSSSGPSSRPRGPPIPRGPDATCQASGTSTTRSATSRSTASMTSSATGRSCSCRRRDTRPGPSLRVRPEPGSGWIFTADACYTREHMDGELLSGVVWDPDVMARSLGHLRALRDQEGVNVVYGHDAAQWETLPQAPRPLVGG